MTSPEQAERVSELVETALDRPPEEWPAFLDERCADDTAVRAEVESLLGYRAEAAGFIEAPAYAAAAESFAGDEGGELQPGEELAQYKILSLLGEGGMGEVYLAEDAELGRKVALKLVKSSFGRADLIRRFRQEERILAALNHPNIARLYGAAATADGTPYFVMEYVEGERLDSYCEARQLSIPDRLQLFCKICAAVSYAHRHLVIHRDLKPANIRVTPEGEPKLLDFGIAKLLDDDDAAAMPETTITMASMMTPEYASPEQVRGEPMTTASDVYSLGVVLYELLTGRKPYRLTSRRADDVSRAITEQQPVRPSAAAADDQAAPSRNQKSLRGDLDNIVLMAMRKEAARRYGSVHQLAEDIQRHLARMPVVARKDTWSYRSSKFVGRHKVAVAAAALIALTLVGGIMATAWQAQRAEQQRARAERRFQEVRGLARALMFEIHDSVADLPGSTRTRQLMVTSALEYLRSLAPEASDDASLLREIVLAYVKVGNVQGNPQNANLGDTAGAMESYLKALAIAEKPGARENPLLRRPLALVYEKMADVEGSSNRIEQAVESARKSLAIFKELAAGNPPEADALRSLATSHLKVGDILGNPNLPNAGDFAGAIQEYGAALQILEILHAQDPQNARTRRLRGMIHERQGAVFEEQNAAAAAVVEYERSAAIRVPLATEFPNEAPIVRDAAIAYEKIGNALSVQGDLPAALEHRRQSLEIFERLHRQDPQNTLAQQSLAVSYIHLGDVLGDPNAPNLGRKAEAWENYQRAAGLLDAINRADSANADSRRRLAELQPKLGALARGEP